MIEIKLREKLPERTHIRDGAVDRIQELLDIKISDFLQQITNIAAMKDRTIITTDVVNSAYVDIEIKERENR
tara:strand:- start:1037 stop:1252 length:216 start_codon:yes stop_codon:yes gene_type:complete